MGNLFFRSRMGKTDAHGVVNLPVTAIATSADTPRRHIDEASLSHLADSIRLHGVIEPLSVAETEDSPAKYRLISGERRLRAAVIAGLDRVPCVIVPGISTAEAIMLDCTTRAGLSIFEEAEALALMIDELSLTQEQAARRLSCSQSAVANKLRLLKFTPDERAAITDGGLTERHARALLRLRDPEQRSLAIDYMVRRRLNVAQAEEYVDALLASPAEVSAKQSQEVKGGAYDVRFFYNSIDRAVELANSAGIRAHADADADGIRIRIG